MSFPVEQLSTFNVLLYVVSQTNLVTKDSQFAAVLMDSRNGWIFGMPVNTRTA
jgi:hypothetical protein